MTDPVIWLPAKDSVRGYTSVPEMQDITKLIRPELRPELWENTLTNPWASALPAKSDPVITHVEGTVTEDMGTIGVPTVLDRMSEVDKATALAVPEVPTSAALAASGVIPNPSGDTADALLTAETQGLDLSPTSPGWTELMDAVRDVPSPRDTPLAETMAEVLQDGGLSMKYHRWTPPNLHPLPSWVVPDTQAYYPHISAWLATGQNARDAVVNLLPVGAQVAADTETMGLGADGFTVKCFTAAWETAQGTVSILLDPVRRKDDREAVRMVMDKAGAVAFHNSAYDVPIMYQNGLMGLHQIRKTECTAVYARLAYPDKTMAKSLENLSVVRAGFPKAEVTMQAGPFKANGWTSAEGWRLMDIDRPIYRLGAMADTVATLRLWNQIKADAWSTLVEGHPFTDYGVDSAGALALMAREQRVNHIMVHRSAVGLGVDTEYLTAYEDKHSRELTAAKDAVVQAGLDPEAGNLGFLLVTEIEKRGELPADWPRTPGGQLRATKDDLPNLDHPLAVSVRKVDELTKVTGYLTKVQDMVKVTGRCHPQVTILGASATGRMSYSWPELQQFPADARPIIVSQEGLTSVDWSQIEPVVMANCAQDAEFLAPFEAGGDLYKAIQEAAGVPRKVAKVLLLAAMYGQGTASMARDLSKPDALGRNVSKAEAQTWRDGMFKAMPKTRGFIDQLRNIGEQHGKIITADGRILTVPKDPKTGQRLAYKAVNYFCQGSAYSVLADTLIRLDDAGLSESIHLALHDELVVDTAAAEAVAEVMRTPPEFLLKWTGGRVPVFKTDTNDMGTAWAYV